MQARLSLLFLLSAGLAPAEPQPLQPPELALEAPLSLAAAARRVRAVEPRRLAGLLDLLGLQQPGPPIRVVLAAEGSEAARNTPSWISGYAYSALGVVVLLPERAPAYPDSSLEELLLHEVAHVLLARAAPGREVPRWFHEGVAMFAGRSWDLEDRSRMTWALLVDEKVPLAELDLRFDAGRAAASRAYAFSGAFVRDLFQRYGAGVAARILGGMALGLPIEEAFFRATGTSLAAAEASFWRRHSFWYRWVPVLSSSVTLWIGITLLALFAIRRRRQRDAQILARWEEEDLPREPPATDDDLVN
jgi:hypothetical protein